ncbi:MAG: type II secretion system protein [Burkholderiales bacterium]
MPKIATTTTTILSCLPRPIFRIAIVSSSCASRQAVRGFSLIEMAIAVFVMGLLLGALLVPLRAQVENRRLADTWAILDQARDTLLGYVAARGHFPCPANATDGGGSGNGQEASGTNHTAGSISCPASVTGSGTSVYVGFFPAASLGFAPVDSNGFARDAWGTQQNRLRYAVARRTVNLVVEPLTRVDGMRTATMNAFITTNELIRICRTGTGVSSSDCAVANDRLANNAMAVIWSLGQNAPTGGSAPHEDKNFRANVLTNFTRVFVQAEVSGTGGSVFDDQLTWVSPAMVFNRMIAAGTLP